MCPDINSSIVNILSIVLCALTAECTYLFINDSIVIENKEFNITCTSPESWKLSSWLFGSRKFYVGNNATGHCVIQGADESIIRCYHNDGKSYIVTVSVRSDQHGENWSCIINSSRSNILTMNVTVPVKNVTLGPGGQSIVLKENVNTGVSCVTSYSRPRAKITWYIDRKSESAPKCINGTEMVCSYVQIYQDLLSTNCTINVKLNRTYNDWHLVCTAENINNYTPVVSGNVTLNITYPTNKPIIQCTKNGIYRVIQHTNGNLTCSVDGGNPAGTLQWNCTGHVTEYQGPHNSIAQTVVWYATQSQYCTCVSTNIAGDSSTSVKTELLYPPVIHKMQNETIIEVDSVTLHCVVTRANPPVYIIRWSSKNHNETAATLTVTNVLRADGMEYTCTANNSMDPSSQDVVQGSTSTSLQVEVLYPPFVNITQGKPYTLKEGDTFKYTCPYVPGNPPSTNITWRRSSDTKTWSSAKLYLNKVTRHDDSVYTCYATNVMVKSNGTTKTGNVSADIRLIVQFKAHVTDFYVEGHGHNISAVVMENTSLQFVCRLQSNPTADVRIYEMETLVESSKTNALLYYTKASCSGAPVNYSCHGNNSLNNISSTRLIELIVKCKPRADTNIFIEYTAINHNVTLSYTALAYPHPSFIWYMNSSSITASDPRNIVTIYNLQTNLTINNVEERDFGEYYLNVSNEFGSITELFQLNPQGVPEVPSNLTQNGTSSTDSIIALNWRPGFNNGLVQTFTLQYSKHAEEYWQNATVNDTGYTDKTVHYNITGLSSNTNYDIVVFAVNTMGRSKSNATLTCRTEARVSHPGQNSSVLIGAIAGSVSGVILMGVAILVVVMVRNRYQFINSSTTNKQTECSTVQSPMQVTYENLKIDVMPNESIEHQRGPTTNHTPETNVDHTYAGLSREDNDKENKYTALCDSSKDDPEEEYENLKIHI